MVGIVEYYWAAGVYATDIREHLINHDGRPPRSYRAIYDTWGPKDNEKRSYSLWASPAEKAARDLRSAERKKTGKPPTRANARVEGNMTTTVLR